MVKKFLLVLPLSLILFISNLQSQCNSVSGLNIDNVILNSSVGSSCNYTATIDLTVSSAGNASACLSYLVSGVETFTCWNKGTTLVDHQVTFTSDCGQAINLSGYSSPSGTGSGCAGAVSFTPPMPPVLPIELVRFSAHIVNEATIVEWVTASEENNDYFELQHSTNGRDFHALDIIRGQGTTSETQFYQYLHSNPIKGDNYYRIKQVDFDGTSEIVDMVTVKFKDGDEIFNVYPSAVFDIVTLETVEPSTKDIEVRIFNSNGQLIRQSIFIKDTDKVSINISDFPGGAYFMQFLNEDFGFITKRFFKMIE